MLRVLLPLAFVLFAGCGSDDSGEREPASDEREKAWLSLVRSEGLEPAQAAAVVEVTGSEPTLRVTLTLPDDAGGSAFFRDGLYGARAFTYEGGEWRRVDTAEIRTQIAPELGPGESVEFGLPVKDAPSYRVLVPVRDRAAWGDSN